MSYIGNEPIVSATRTITEISATAGQTVFVPNGGYTVGFIDVFVNGAQLQTSDFTATNGSSITLNSGASAGDDIRLVAWGKIGVANAVLKTGDAMTGNLTVPGLSVSGSTSGSVALAVPAVAGSNTATLPAATGTVMVSGNMPAFSAYLPTSNQSVTSSVVTKVTLSAEIFDTNSNFDTSTYRFTPTVAGYYQINGQVFCNSGGTSSTIITYIYKNGAEYCRNQLAGSFGQGATTTSAVVYLNGTTDYVELYGMNTAATAPVFQSGSNFTYFSGCLVRAA